MTSYESSVNPTNVLRGILVELEKISLDSPNLTDKRIEESLNKMELLDLSFLPYAAITQVVYNKEDDKQYDYRYFIDFFYEALQSYRRRGEKDNGCSPGCKEGDSCERCIHVYIVGMKVFEHLNLAQQQKESLYLKHQAEIESIHKSLSEIDELKKEMKGMTSSYITILGIFAAILLGAFGAMQGFTSLFENASEMKMSKVLVISGVGGVTVVTILHMLLDGIAKLSGSRIVSDSQKEATPYERYPFLFISLYSLWAIIVAGVSLKYAQEYPTPFSADFTLILFYFSIGCFLPLSLYHLGKLIKETSDKRNND